MRRLLSFTAPLVAALALPALAQASTGTVLSVSKSHHQVQLIAPNKTVHAFSFRGKLRGATRGSELSYTASGSRITRARVLGIAHSFSFLATVVRSKNGALVLSLGDSQQLHLTTRELGSSKSSSAALHARSGNITVNINGLQPGQTVIVTESTDASGNVTITITLPSGGAGGFGSELSASGLVNNVGDDSFDIITADGSDLNFHMNAEALANVGMDSCDQVVVTYHTDDEMMIADSVVDNGPPDTGACSTGSDDPGDWIGTITAISATSVTVDAGAGNGGPQTFEVQDPSVTLGFLVGDSVDVSFEQDGSQFIADNISYNDQPTSGVVTAMASVGDGFDTITMIDDYTQQSETFYASDDLLQGQGVSIGDDVSVSYYQAARGLTLDCLQDNGPASS